MEETIPVTTGVFAGLGANAGTPLGPEGIAAGSIVGGTMDAGIGVIGGTVAEALRRCRSNSAPLRKVEGTRSLLTFYFHLSYQRALQ